MNKELLEAVKLFISQPLNNPLSRGQIMEVARIALPILEQQERGDGWIEWKGGDCPVSSETEVEVRMRDGYVGIAPADTFRWKLAVRDQFPAADIIAYRVIENDGREG